MLRSVDNLQAFILSFHHVDLGGMELVLVLDSKYLNPLRYLARSRTFCFVLFMTESLAQTGLQFSMWLRMAWNFRSS